MGEELKRKIRNLANKGNTQMAFKKKENYNYFKKIMKEKGYNVGHIKSTGKVVDAKGVHKAYYGIAEKKTLGFDDLF